ncbi:MAG: response regulator [Desulfosarcina sp.]|nr:response regulator [Desulfobacterales bacterium]
MKAKVLFFDDIFSDLFRNELPPDQLVWDDNWIVAVEQGLAESDERSGYVFDLVKTGEINSWRRLIEEEKPDIVLLDLFWPAEASVKFKDRNRGSDIALEVTAGIHDAFPTLPVACYTLKPDKDLMEKAYRDGATIFLEKVALALPEVQSPLKYILIYLMKQANLAKS